jgi:hypothetical protein
MRKLFVLLAALVSFDASAASVWAALYGVEETFEFEIWSSDGLTLDVDETDDGNDVLVQCDQDAAAESTNTYTDEGSHYAVVLTAAELDCQYITVHINETVANVFYIQTYGHASAMVASFAQTGDSFARLGAPAGASVSADIAAIEGQTDDIGVAGAGLTNIDLPNQTMGITGNITGNLSGSVGSVTTVSDKTGYALSTAGVNALRDVVIEDQGGGVSLACALAVLLAYAAGDISTTGADSTYEDPAGAETRIAGTVASTGNRTAAITCPSF